MSPLGVTRSQGSQRDKKAKDHKAPYHLHRRTFDHKHNLGFLDLEMNSDIGDPRQRNCELLCFDLRDADEIHSLKMMKVIAHKNVLHVRAIKRYEKEPLVAVYVDQFTGALDDLLRPGIRFSYASTEDVVPSTLLQELISEIVDGLDCIRECGYYHGNLSQKTTLYHKHVNGYRIKLSHFQIKGSMDSQQYQRDDWVSLGELLNEISQRARSFSAQLRVGLIDDLAAKLKSFSFKSLETVKDEVKAHPFFWNSPKRKDFFTTEVPHALKNNIFVTRLTNIQLQLAWNINTYDGYLPDMFKYRADNSLTAYNVNDMVDYVKCISGMYTHEMQYRGNRKSVDCVLQARNYRLCLLLKNAMS